MKSRDSYELRLARYVTAMRNEKPDRVPIRPFVAEFTARYAGMTCQDVAHDYRRAFEAAVRTAQGFDWDAVVPNMVYVWTGLAQAAGLRYYGIPGIHIPPQAIEPIFLRDRSFKKYRTTKQSMGVTVFKTACSPGAGQKSERGWISAVF